MAAEDGGLILTCGVCGRHPQSVHGMRLLRCGHGMCRECSSAVDSSRHPCCRQCVVPASGVSRPQSFAEFNLEASLTGGHFSCQERAESCPALSQASRCYHCNLYLCPEHLRRHGQMVMESAAGDLRRLVTMRQSIVQQTAVEKSSAAGREYNAFKEGADSKLKKLSNTLQALEAVVRQPIIAYEKQIMERSQQRNKVLAEADTMFEHLQVALMRGNPEEVLNAQRTFQYMEMSGAYNLSAQPANASRFGVWLDTVVAAEAQINGAMSALQGLQELLLPARSDDDGASSELGAAVSNEQLANRSANSPKFSTFETPFDVDCYSAPNEPLVLFVTEANSDESKVTLRCYTEPAMNCQEVPLAFFRNQQLITDFQPRKIAVLAAKKQLAMTDCRSSHYCRHVFTCDFTGQSGHRVFRVEKAKQLNGIHASGSQLYVCDTVDCSVFILNCSENNGRHVRVASSESVPCSVSTWNAWMLVAYENNVKLFSLESLQQVESPRERGPRESVVYIESSCAESGQAPAASATQRYQDIAHLSNGAFAAATATSVRIYNADMTPVRSIDTSAPGCRFEDLTGMCATECGGTIRLFLCDRGKRQICVIQV